MAMSRAMFSGVSGLQAHQTAMDVIGNNVANVSTNGFKASRTVYRDMLYSSVQGASGSTNNMGGNNPSQVGAGSQVSSIDVINTNGGRAATNRSLDAYIDGEGYFTVATSSGETQYSRLGRFDFDADGNLVDGNNQYVLGYLPKDPEHLAYVDGIKVNLDSNNTGYGALLDGFAIQIKEDSTKGTDAGAITEADYEAKTITITVKDKDKFTQKELKAVLTPANLKTASVWKNLPDEIVDPVTGKTEKKASATADSPFITAIGQITAIEVGDAKDNTKALATGSYKISETTECDTSKAPSKINYSALDSVKSLSVGADGTITGIDSKSGKVVTIGQVAIATFANPNGLTEMGNSYYSVSANSGAASYTAAGNGAAGKLVSSALEGSNVDLANEFSNMILTQRGFQANSKIITVSDTMLEELINLKR